MKFEATHYAIDFVNEQTYPKCPYCGDWQSWMGRKVEKEKEIAEIIDEIVAYLKTKKATVKESVDIAYGILMKMGANKMFTKDRSLKDEIA